MSFLPISGIIYAGENFDATMTGDDAIAPDESDTLSAAVSEITADEAALTQGNDQIDSAAVAADGLETIAEHVAEANEGDGIDESTAEIVEAAVESILRLGKIGVSAKRIGLPATESFRSRSNRHRLGEATVESLKETAKNIWKSIIEAIRKSIDWVRGFFNKIFGAAERLARRAKALVEKSKELDDKKEDVEDIESDSLYNGILVGDKLPQISDLKAVQETAKKLYSSQSDMVEALGDKLEDSVSGFLSAVLNPKDIGFEGNTDANIRKRIDSRDGLLIFLSPALPGNTRVYITVARGEILQRIDDQKVGTTIKTGDTKDSADRISTFYKAGSVKTSEAKAKEDTTLKILDKGTISEWAHVVEMYANEIVEYKKNIPKTERAKDKAIKKLETVMKERGEKSGSHEGKKGSDIKQIVKINASIFRKLMDEPAASFASKSIAGMSKALEYAERSANQYNVRD